VVDARIVVLRFRNVHARQNLSGAVTENRDVVLTSAKTSHDDDDDLIDHSRPSMTAKEALKRLLRWRGGQASNSNAP
jgi:hypothetical protein